MITKIVQNNYSPKAKMKNKPSFKGAVHLVCDDIKKHPKFYDYCNYFYNRLSFLYDGLQKNEPTNKSFSIKYPKELDEIMEALFGKTSPNKIFNTNDITVSFERGDVNFPDKLKIN